MFPLIGRGFADCCLSLSYFPSVCFFRSAEAPPQRGRSGRVPTHSYLRGVKGEPGAPAVERRVSLLFFGDFVF